MEKNVKRRHYFCLGYTIMKLKIPLKHCFYTDEKLFELFCIENNFPKYSAKCHNLLYLFKYFVIHYNNPSK